MANGSVIHSRHRRFRNFGPTAFKGPLHGPASHRLSGGQRRCEAIARALLTRFALVLMDETQASLDTQRKQDILPCLERLRAELTMAVLCVIKDKAAALAK